MYEPHAAFVSVSLLLVALKRRSGTWDSPGPAVVRSIPGWPRVVGGRRGRNLGGTYEGTSWLCAVLWKSRNSVTKQQRSGAPTRDLNPPLSLLRHRAASSDLGSHRLLPSHRQRPVLDSGG